MKGIPFLCFASSHTIVFDEFNDRMWDFWSLLNWGSCAFMLDRETVIRIYNACS